MNPFILFTSAFFFLFTFSEVAHAQTLPDLTIAPNPPGTLTSPSSATVGVPMPFAIEIKNIGTGSAVDHTDPTFVGETQGPDPDISLDGAHSVFVSGDYAYVANFDRHSLAVIDISDPANPDFRAEVIDPIPGFPGASLYGAASVFVSGNYAYVANSFRDSLAVIDISDPENPIFIAEERGPFPGVSLDGAYSVFVSGNYAYVANTDQDSIAIIDISVPEDPIFISEVRGPFPGFPGASLDGASSVFVSGNYAYVANFERNSLAVINISVPTNPTFSAEVFDPSLDSAHFVLVSGNYAYLANYYIGSLAVIDISDPANPDFRAEVIDPIPGFPGASLDGAHSVFVSGNYAYVANSVRDSLAIIDISDPENPDFRAEVRGPFPGFPGVSLAGASSVFVLGNYAYLVGYIGSLSIIDLGGPFSNVLKMSNDSLGNNPVFLATNTAGPLAAGAQTTGFSISYTPIAGDVGTKYFQICAEQDITGAGVIPELNEGNNCSDWTPVTISHPAPTVLLLANGEVETYLQVGNTAALTWSSDGVSCTSANFSTGAGSPPNSPPGGVTVGPFATPGISPYQIDCVSAQGASGFSIATVHVVEPSAKITARPPRVPPNLTSTSIVTAECVDVASGHVFGPGVDYSGDADASEYFVYTFITPPITTQFTYTVECVAVSGLDPTSSSVDIKLKPNYTQY